MPDPRPLRNDGSRTPRASGIFPLLMAWRETRGAHRHFVYFLVCITVGVGALVAVQSFSDSLARTVARSAKSLLSADVEIRSTHPLSTESAAIVDGLTREGATVTSVREMVAMAQAGHVSRSLLVELKAVESGYPFYGRLVTDPDRPLASLLGHGQALVHPSFLTRLGLAVGDRIRIGDLDLVISGVIREEPDRSLGVFSLGPRVLIAADDLDRTGLVRPGSRVRYRTLIRLPDDKPADAFRDALAARIPDRAVRIVTYSQAQPGFRRFWTQLTTYLAMTGLVALMVGGIGVAVSVRAFVREKFTTIAVLKCLGAGWRDVFAIYLVQTLFLGLAGSLAGAALGTGLQLMLAPVLVRLVPFPVDLIVSPRAILNGLVVGVGVTLLFAIWPLLEIRRVSPALLLRSQVSPRPGGRRPWSAALAIGGGLAALAMWQAGSWKIGGLFIGGLGAALGLLALSARLIVALARRARRGSLAWRQGTANLHRPGSQAAPVLISLGLAVMLIVAVALLEANLREALAYRSAGSAPAFFFLDIQPDQAEPFRQLVTADGGLAPELTPVVRSRLAAVNGTAVAPDVGRRRDDVWYLTREYVLTWSPAPPSHNTIVAGRWWTGEEAAREPLMSVEEEIAKELGLTLSGTLTFDIQGVPVTGRVKNLRRVDWESLDSNFFVIFSQGA